MHGHLSSAEGDHTRPLKRGEEAARALARGAGQMGDLRLGRADQHVALRCALGLAGDRLREQRTCHPPRDRLKRLLEQPLVGSAHPLGERSQQLQREVGMASDQALHVAGEQGNGARGLDRLRRRRTRLSPEHGQLAKQGSGPQLGQRDHPTVLMLARENHRAGANEVAGVTGIALAEDDLAPIPVSWHRHLGYGRQLGRLEIAEDFGARQQAGGFLPIRHARIIPWVAPRTGHPPVAAGEAVTVQHVEAAARLIAGDVRKTPLLPAGELGRRVGARVWLKTENLQITGSFKLRGAVNSIRRLPEEAIRAGVVAASAGNHAQAVACAASDAGGRAVLVMPEQAPLAKVAAVRQYGGDVRLVEGGYDEAHTVADRMAEEDGLTVVEAFDAPEVVAGQGTIGLEIAEHAPDVRLVVVPLGGGGLVSGIAVALTARIPDVRVVGVQAAACAPYIDSLAAHRPIGARSANTICDGIAVKRPGDFTLPLVERYVDEVVTVTDDEVAEAMVLLLERSKLVVEGAGAVAVAALLQGRVEMPPAGEVCAVLSGGNVDASLLSECIRLGETAAGRRMVLSTVVPDRPGALAGLLRVVAEHGGNVVDVEHLRDGIEIHVRETAIKLVLQTRGRENNQEILDAARAEGFSVRVERDA